MSKNCGNVNANPPRPPITYTYRLFTLSTVRRDTQDRNGHFDTVRYLELLIPQRPEHVRRCSNFVMILLLF